MSDEKIRILFIGDIVGSPGLRAVCNLLSQLKEQYDIDFCIANAENVAGGFGLTQSSAKKLYQAGVDALTLGNHAWSKQEILGWIDQDDCLARPANGHPDWPGRGYVILEKDGYRLAVLNLLGSAFMSAPISPFIHVKEQITRLRGEYGAQAVVVDFHAEATAEKMAMGYYLDGSVSALLGTHTHVQTADERILPLGTAYITDVGMTGAADGVIGMAVDCSLRRLADNLPARYAAATGPVLLQAVCVTIDKSDGKALLIERLQILEPEPEENLEEAEQTVSSASGKESETLHHANNQ